MKRAFTLLEVVIATLIASIAAIAALNIGVQSSKIADQLTKRKAILAPLSIAALHGKSDFHNTEKTYESLLSGAYAIDHEGLKRYLQERSVFYTQELYGRWEIALEEEIEGAELPRFEIIVKTIGAEGLEGRIYAVQPETL
ncbi:MAG: prepilin-type N-terminal cleavage/methylation domain-containing protein [Helicobacteraceae bacterium]|jgi:prepilin-type N-terminal cleavage/methylation domain-containing protein|nr:prepilin-type N-terminal cleavage/methylation domain-containing protein [Helicobacteraceae bacterium]